MPHLTLEYSANLEEPDLAGLFAALHEVVATLGFAVDDCKSRATRCESYRQARLSAAAPVEAVRAEARGPREDAA
jgi:5-carboxymethyl-2-hydroxymuconate isomerase